MTKKILKKTVSNLNNHIVIDDNYLFRLPNRERWREAPREERMIGSANNHLKVVNSSIYEAVVFRLN